MLQIRLPEKPVNHGRGETISVKQLLQPPSKKAFRSFVEAQRFSDAGDYTRAVTALERAVRESPGYAEAHVNLGAQYVRTGRFAEAVTELNRALDITGPAPVTLCNLAAAQLRLGRRAQAIESARAALRLDGGSPQGHLILGVTLAIDPGTREEAIPHLRIAANHYESARRVLKDIGGQ